MRNLFIIAMFFCRFAYADQGNSTINECWVNHNHIEMSECVENRLVEARANLGKMEEQIHQAILKKNLPAAANKQFNVSAKLFKEYVKSQCSFSQSVASGGNGEVDIRNACEVDLNNARTEQLKNLATWLVK